MICDKIEEIVDKLLNLKKSGKSKEYIDSISEFNDFKISNNTLYDTILSGGYDNEIFKTMMKLKRKIEEGGDSYDGDVKFGKYMAEKFIDPVIKK